MDDIPSATRVLIKILARVGRRIHYTSHHNNGRLVAAQVA